ncbi:MAG: glutathione S-transferase family protein [Caulobacter sp.]
MILYGASLSPFVRKTLAYAAEKGIEVTHKVPPFGQPDPEFMAVSPFGKIPALKDGDFSIPDSSAIIHYFEAIKPEPALIPADPKDRARVIWFEEYADTILVGASGPLFFNRIVARLTGAPSDEAAAARAETRDVPPVLDYLERVMPDSGHLVADRLTLADIAVASPFVNLLHLRFDLAPWPKVKAWSEAMLARPSFARWVTAESRLLSR